MQITRKNILFIHQSTDLYGSDKALLYLMKGLNKELFNPIVVLPNSGPLNKEIQKLNIKIIVTPVLNIHRRMFSVKGILSFPFFLLKSIKTLNRELGNLEIDLIHSNTAVVCLGAFYAKRYRVKHLWHIHEIVKTPKLAAKFFSFMVYHLSDIIVFNSRATQSSFLKYKPQLSEKSLVIYNGIDRIPKVSSAEEIIRLRESFKVDQKDILFGLFGRINENKGHDLLLSVIRQLYKKNTQIKLLIIGSTVKGKEKLLDILKDKVARYGLEECVTILPFQQNIWNYWDIIDIAVVPSTVPESFGLVALEAMLSKKAVIASNEGGLKEIVKDQKTGMLFTPNDANALASSLSFLLENKEKVKIYGEQGYNDALELFTLEKYILNFETIYAN